MSLCGPLLAIALSAAAGAPKAVVLLAPEDRALVMGPVISSVQSQLSDLAVELRVEPVDRLEGSLAARMSAADAVQGALAVIWLDLNPGEPIFIYVAEPKGHRIFVRNLDWDSAGAHYAASGLIVRSAVQALLAGGSIGFEPPAGERASPSGPDPFLRVPKDPGVSLAVRLSYTPSLLAPDLPARHGADLGVQVGFGAHLYAGAGYRLYPLVFKRMSEWAVAFMSRHPIWLAAGGRTELGPLEVGLDLCATLDPVGIQISVSGPWRVPAPPQINIRWLAGPSAWAAIRLVGRLSAVAGLGVDFPLGASNYVIEQSGKRGVVLEPYEVQPRASLGLRWDAL